MAPSRPDPAEADLVARIRAGDRAAFGVLFHQHFAPLCGFVKSYVGERVVAEELVQDLFCALWHRRADWQPVGRVRHYLLVAARNRALKYFRDREVVERHARRWTGAAAAGDAPPAMGAGATCPDREAELAELADACRRAVHALPERRRLIVTLRWEHQMTYAEIAHALGISVKGVEVQLSRAFKALRRQLAQFRA